MRSDVPHLLLRSPIKQSHRRHRFCHLCGHRLYGSFVKYDNGLVICIRCHSELPRCHGCGIPSYSLQTVAREPSQQTDSSPTEQYCLQCIARMPRCSACGKPIATSYLQVGDSPAAYCRQCMAQRPHCDVCGAPLGPGSQILPDNQSRCASCAATAIYHEAEAQQLYQQVIAVTSTTLGLHVAHPPTLHVVSRRELDRLRSSFGGEDQIAPQHLLGFFAQRGLLTSIYAEYGLPRALLIGTLAHEFGHAWQAEHCPWHQSEFRREGFAEWVSYRVLLALGYACEAARATQREDIYGSGLRHFISVEQQSGLVGVLADARRP
jgi:hypothetical protein